MSSYPFQPVQDTDSPSSKPSEQQVIYTPPPPRALNGGLYTGEKFLEGAPWGNVPVIPDVDYMTNVNLRSANPPPRALFQYPGNTRPGNNWQKNSGLQPYEGPEGFAKAYNFSCLSCKTLKQAAEDCKCQRTSYISGNTFGVCECQDKIVVPV